MKLRFFQPQTQWIDKKVVSGAPKVKWYDDGPRKLQYYLEEAGYWQDVELVTESEEALYDGEWTMR